MSTSMIEELAPTTTIIPNRFSGKVAIVTGGASGMGRAQAIRLASEGALVAILDLNRKNGEDTVKDIESTGGLAVFEQVDLTKTEDIDACLSRVREHLGPAHMLFNNAGVVLVKAYTETSESEFDHIMNTNVRSSFMVTKRVIPQLIENGGGSIVLMSSISALRGFALEAIYGVSKAAVHSLMMNIAVEFREQGIRCNAVCPAFVRTAHGMLEIEHFGELGVEWTESDLAETQMRICEPEEVANVALFLASQEAAFLNGIAVTIDNGWMAKA